jgi:DNA-binding NtrC family response regulator
LSVVSLRIPPLRERRRDIPILATRFVQRAALETGKEVQGIAPDALDILQRHDWPGNVRQLQHTVERAVILSADPILGARLFELERSDAARRGGADEASGAETAPQALPPGAVVLTSLDVNEAERVLIRRALDTTGGNRTHAARLLGISVRTLRNKLNMRSADDDEAGDAELGSPP